MRSLARILVFIQAGAVKSAQSVHILRKILRNPVQNNADVMRMHVIHEEHEILRIAVAGGRGKIPGGLISPRFILRMLHDRHQFHMRIPHLLNILCKKRRHLPVIVKLTSILRLLPGSEMNFIDGHRFLFQIGSLTGGYPFFIGPVEAVQIGYDGGGMRAQLCLVRIGIGFQESQSALRLDFIFINCSFAQIRHEDFKNSGIPETTHRIAAAIPQIEVAYQADAHRVWRPDRKISSLYSVYGHRM